MGNPYHDAVGKFATKGGRIIVATGNRARVDAQSKITSAKAYAKAHPKQVRAARITAGVAIGLAGNPEFTGSLGAYTMARAASNRTRYASAAARGLGAVPKATKATRGVYKITKL